jgi:hypothetical protein
MIYLKIIFYGLLAMFERRPIFTIGLLALLILPPIYFPWVRWFMLGMLIFIIISVLAVRRKIQKMRSDFEKQYRDAMGGNAGAGFGGFSGFSNAGGAGFSGFNFAQGMRLEDFVQQMQQQADARQAQQQTSVNKSSETASKRDYDQGEYVDFEEIK